MKNHVALLSIILLITFLAACNTPAASIVTPTPSPTPFPLEGSSISKMAISNDGKYMAIGTDRNLYLYQTDTLNIRWSIDLGTMIWKNGFNPLIDVPIASIAFTPDYMRVVSFSWGGDSKGGSEDIASMWNVSTGALLKQATCEGQADGNSYALSPDGNIFSVSQRMSLRLCTWDNQAQVFSYNHLGEIFSQAWSPDGKEIIMGLNDNSLIAFDVNSSDKNNIQLVNYREIWKDAFFPKAISWSPDGSTYAVITPDNIVLEGTIQSKSPVPFGTVSYGQLGNLVAWSPDTTEMAVEHVGDNYGNSNISIWNISSGQIIGELKGLKGKYIGIGWLPGNLIIGSSDSEIIEWDTLSGNILKQIMLP